MARVRVVVIKKNLKYRIPGYKEGESFVPKVGQMIPLSKEIALIELRSGNVRKLLHEEKEAILQKRKKDKK